MSLRTFAGFVADFPTGRGEDDAPAGKELADAIAAHLRTTGIEVEGPSEREGWAWDVTSQIDGVRIDCIIALVDDMETTPPRQWLITSDSGLNIWQKMFGSGSHRQRRDSSLRKFCEILHRLLASDSRFSHVMWYNEQSFDRPGDVPGEAP